MKDSQVFLSRAAGEVVNRLKFDYQQDFIRVVSGASSVSRVPEPFRSWLLNVDSIPEEARRTAPINLR